MIQRTYSSASVVSRGARHSNLTYQNVEQKIDRLVPAILGRIIPSAKIVRFSAHDIIHRAGTPVESLYALRSGLVKLVHYLPNGRSRIVRLHVRGELLGLGGLLGQGHEQTAVAVDDVVAYRLPVAAIQRLEYDEGLYRQLAAIWYAQLRDADTWITQFSTGSSKARVARLVAHLSRIEPEAEPGHVRLLICDDMAAILGITLESVSRALAQFKRDGLLRPVAGRTPEWYRCALPALDRLAQDTRTCGPE